MRNDSRLSRMLHALLHMARRDEALTSEALAGMLETNSVVVRRTMAGLREAGLVRSEKGHGGGWRIARDLSHVSLLDVYRAVGEPRIFAIGNASDHPTCAVERVVNAALDESLAEAQAMLSKRLASVRLSELARGFKELSAPHLPPRELARRRRRPK